MQSTDSDKQTTKPAWPDNDKNRAYHERNQLVALLARIYPGGTRRTEIEGWDRCWHGCVYIDTPAGQLSWHYHDNEAHLFASLNPYVGEWDGHTTEEKYHRTWTLCRMADNGEDILEPHDGFGL